jgi:protein-S-isoprenylcysteine O-methyltransferase Ste14
VHRIELKVPPPIYALGLALLMWAVSLAPPHLEMRMWIRVGAVLVFGGLAVITMVAALVVLLRARTTIDPHAPDRAKVLVTAGIYARTRNPMYLSMLLALMAFAGWLANPFTVLLALAFIPLITRVQILPEERALTVRFGQPYRAYCARVKRWV